jgi:hypothetical protein
LYQPTPARATFRHDGWRNVSRSEPCAVCGKPDWCSRTGDGRLVLCQRVASERPCRRGGWFHRADLAPLADDVVVPARLPLAPIAHRHAAYRALLDALDLSDPHRAHLLGVRAVPPALLDLFATIPPGWGWAERMAITDRVNEHVGSVAGVPGFCRRRHGWALVPTAAGCLVPFLDRQGRILGVQVRADEPVPGEPRYKWLSSDGWPGGTSSGAPAGVWRPELALTGVMIVEGSLKALAAAYRLEMATLVVAGVGNWRGVLPLLAGAPPDYPVTIAYDADVATKIEVWRAREDLALTLHRGRCRVLVATWDGARAKGVDDALLAGLEIGTQPWQPSLAPVTRPSRTVALAPLARPVGVPLVGVSR